MVIRIAADSSSAALLLHNITDASTNSQTSTHHRAHMSDNHLFPVIVCCTAAVMASCFNPWAGPLLATSLTLLRSGTTTRKAPILEVRVTSPEECSVGPGWAEWSLHHLICCCECQAFRPAGCLHVAYLQLLPMPVLTWLLLVLAMQGSSMCTTTVSCTGPMAGLVCAETHGNQTSLWRKLAVSQVGQLEWQCTVLCTAPPAFKHVWPPAVHPG